MKTFRKDAGSVRRELDARAEDFSNFEEYEVIEDDNFEDFEDFEDFDDADNYIGDGDEFLDFGGMAISFAAHNQGYRTASIQINVTSGNTSVSKLQLFGDLLVGAVDSSKPMIKEGVISEESGATTISAQGSPKSINQLLAWLQQQPSVLQGIQLATSQTSILSSIIERYETSPFRDMATDPINLSVFRNEYQFQNNILTIPQINQVIGNQNYWYITIPTATAFTLTINLYFGASLNTSTALQNKMRRANSNILRMGGSKFVNALTTGNVNGMVGNQGAFLTALGQSRTAGMVKPASMIGGTSSVKSGSALRRQQRAERKANRQARRNARKNR